MGALEGCGDGLVCYPDGEVGSPDGGEDGSADGRDEVGSAEGRDEETVVDGTEVSEDVGSKLYFLKKMS